MQLHGFLDAEPRGWFESSTGAIDSAAGSIREATSHLQHDHAAVECEQSTCHLLSGS